jgi:uncharacterized membrane protein
LQNTGRWKLLFGEMLQNGGAYLIMSVFYKKIFLFFCIIIAICVGITVGSISQESKSERCMNLARDQLVLALLAEQAYVSLKEKGKDEEVALLHEANINTYLTNLSRLTRDRRCPQSESERAQIRILMRVKKIWKPISVDQPSLFTKEIIDQNREINEFLLWVQSCAEASRPNVQ